MKFNCILYHHDIYFIFNFISVHHARLLQMYVEIFYFHSFWIIYSHITVLEAIILPLSSECVLFLLFFVSEFRISTNNEN